MERAASCRPLFVNKEIKMEKVLAKGLIVGGKACSPGDKVDVSDLSKEAIANLDKKGYFAGKAAAKGAAKAADEGSDES